MKLLIMMVSMAVHYLNELQKYVNKEKLRFLSWLVVWGNNFTPLLKYIPGSETLNVVVLHSVPNYKL